MEAISAQLKQVESMQLNGQEQACIGSVITEVLTKYGTASNPAFISQSWYYARQLPDRVMDFLHAFRYHEDNCGVALIQGYQVDPEELGRTPSVPNRTTGAASPGADKVEVLLVLFNSVIGDLISWSTQRDGALINDIVPVKGNEFEQLSTGSKSGLEWHVEEAFHVYRPDNVGLACLRNLDGVPTTFGFVCNLELPEEVKKILFQPRFIFFTDNNFSAGRWQKFQQPEAVLFGSFHDPYVRIDPAFMQAVPGDAEAEEALAAVINCFNNTLVEVELQPGDYCFIDNFRAVHGRKGFVPRYDGQDRWLKRVLVTRDLRKSREARVSFDSRVILTD